MDANQHNDKRPPSSTETTLDWRWFAFGCLLFLVAAGFAVWTFALGTLSDDQRKILLWILPIASGFAAGAFAGALSVKLRKLIPGATITATGGFGVWLICFFFLFPSEAAQPLVVMMDSTLPDLVYDPNTLATGGTNADDITQVLKDLPVRTIKETTSLQWSRDQQLLKLDPDLIIIHMSAFYSQTNPLDSERKFKEFLKFMAASKAKFLIYSRGITRHMTRSEEIYLLQRSGLLDLGIGPERLHILPMLEGARSTFRDAATARRLKLRVKDILNLT